MDYSASCKCSDCRGITPPYDIFDWRDSSSITVVLCVLVNLLFNMCMYFFNIIHLLLNMKTLNGMSCRWLSDFEQIVVCVITVLCITSSVLGDRSGRENNNSRDGPPDQRRTLYEFHEEHSVMKQRQRSEMEKETKEV